VNARGETLLWLAQRASAALLAFCVLVHLATIIVAVQGGLSAAEILGRTRGNVAGLVFYTTFVIAAAVHAPIGLRATPDSIAAFATATGTVEIKRGSNGTGMMYWGPNCGRAV